MTTKLIALIVLGVVLATAIILSIFSKPDESGITVPDNLPSRACAEITMKQRKYNCLAIVNKDSDLCNKTAEDGILACRAIVENNPELCTKVKPAVQKKTCVNEVARVNDNIASCDFPTIKRTASALIWPDCIGIKNLT